MIKQGSTVILSGLDFKGIPTDGFIALGLENSVESRIQGDPNSTW